jgi:hypothetical protein
MRYVVTVTLWDATEFTITCHCLEATLLHIEGVWGDSLWCYSVRRAREPS